MPVIQSIAPVVTRVFTTKVILTFTAIPAAELMVGGQVGLFTAGPLPITPDSNDADFTQATFSGYANVNGTWGTALNLPSLEGQGSRAVALFVHNGGPVAENILGYVVRDADGDLAFAETFDTPIPMNALGDFISLETYLPIGFTTPVSN